MSESIRHRLRIFVVPIVRSMYLLFILTAYPPSTGGAQLYTHLLAQRMAQAHAVKVVCQWDTNRTDWLLGTTVRAPTDDKDYVIDGVPVRRMGLSLSHKLRLAPLLPMYYPMMHIALPRIADRLRVPGGQLAERGCNT